MDDIPLIFDPYSGRYHRISRTGERLVALLDGSRSREDLVTLLASSAAGTEQAGSRLDSFLDELARSGLLEGTRSEEVEDSRTQRVQTSLLMPRVVLTRALPGLLEPLARAIRRVPGPLALAVVVAGAVAGFGFGIYTLITALPPIAEMVGPALLIASVVMLVQVLLHESSHALVAQVYRVPVRGLGVALLFYFMPLAYVDRTDAYRLRDRAPRVVLALAGPMTDGWLTGVNAIVMLTTEGTVQHVAAFLLLFQIVGLVINLNPLMPSDGYSAIESGTGLVDMRGRAFALLTRIFTRKPLPSYLRGMPSHHRWLHVLYAVCCVIYTGVIALGMTAFMMSVFALVERTLVP